MRNKKGIRVFVTVLMAAMLTGSIVGCSTKKEVAEIEDMEPVKSPAFSFDVIGGKDVMPLWGYWGPTVLDWSQMYLV